VNTLSLLLQEGPDAGLSWLLWIVLGLFLLIVVIGWLVSRGRSSEPAISEREIVEETYEDKKPLDDLTKLEGIGPKVAQVLHRAGIESYSDLAQADPVRLEEALRAAGLQMMEPRGWIEQARLAAEGDMEGLAKLQQELKGGRRDI
jgi:hypothetical protein